ASGWSVSSSVLKQEMNRRAKVGESPRRSRDGAHRRKDQGHVTTACPEGHGQGAEPAQHVERGHRRPVRRKIHPTDGRSDESDNGFGRLAAPRGMHDEGFVNAGAEDHRNHDRVEPQSCRIESHPTSPQSRLPTDRRLLRATLDTMSSARTHRKTRLDSVSSQKGGDPATRERICEAALRLIVKRGGVDVPLADVAKAARVSRQALYLHFKDRAALFLAVAQHADDKRGLPEAIRRLQQAPTGLDALRYMAATRATLNPEIWPLARIPDSVRREEPPAEITLQNRLGAGLSAC